MLIAIIIQGFTLYKTGNDYLNVYTNLQLGRNGARIHVVSKGIQFRDVLVLAAAHTFSRMRAKAEARKSLTAGGALRATQ